MKKNTTLYALLAILVLTLVIVLKYFAFTILRIAFALIDVIAILCIIYIIRAVSKAK